MSRSSSFLWRSPLPYVTVGVIAVLTGMIAAYWFQLSGATTVVKVGSGEYRVWTTNTEPGRIKGLSGVAKLPENGGLLMDFESDGQWGIWMKDMKIPIDIVWLDSERRVVHIVEHASPETPEITYLPIENARYVLELPAGSVRKAVIERGTVADFDITHLRGDR